MGHYGRYAIVYNMAEQYISQEWVECKMCHSVKVNYYIKYGIYWLNGLWVPGPTIPLLPWVAEMDPWPHQQSLHDWSGSCHHSSSWDLTSGSLSMPGPSGPSTPITSRQKPPINPEDVEIEDRTIISTPANPEASSKDTDMAAPSGGVPPNNTSTSWALSGALHHPISSHNP